MVATPSRSASARMVSSASPSASASSTAARTTRCRVRSCSEAVGLGFWPRARATTVPTRGSATTTPSLASSVSALAAVARATFQSRASCLVEGTRSPGRSLPSAMRRLRSAAIRAWGGVVMRPPVLGQILSL